MSEYNWSPERLSDRDTETIKDGVWRPGIMEKFSGQVHCGASTKELKRLINREAGRVRITAKPDRFDLPFGQRNQNERVEDLAAGRIIAELLKRVDPEADPHKIIKTKLTHDREIVVVDEDYINNEQKDLARVEADGMVTNMGGSL